MTIREQETAGTLGIAVLLSEHRPLDEPTLRAAAHRAIGIDPNLSVDGSHDFVQAGQPTSKVQWGDWVLHIHAHSGYYFKDPSAIATRISDLRLRTNILEHRAWMAVDVPRAPKDAGSAMRFTPCARLFAELVDHRWLAIAVPDKKLLMAATDNIGDHLRAMDPIEALRKAVQAPVVSVEGAEEQMQVAVAQAQRRFPEFVIAFEDPGRRRDFAVKAPFTEGDCTEYMWVAVVEIGNDVISGKLGNKPVSIRSLHEGDPVEVRLADLNDWMFTDGDRRVGGFTTGVTADPSSPTP
jgi:uncharacterized protein YegJ (DUF2314 family)